MTSSISVVVPVRDGAPWIARALASMAGQSLAPTEILVADDGSTDGTAEIVAGLGLPGVRMIGGPERLGISTRLNSLIEQSRGRWIARMDADDFAHSERFARQIPFMEANRIAVCGTSCRRTGAASTVHRFARKDGVLKAGLLFSVPFCHPSVVFDRERVQGEIRYDPDFDLAEDYRLWATLRRNATYGNVDEILLDWTMHDRNAGTAPDSAAVQRARAGAVRDGLLRDYGISLDYAHRATLEDRALGRTLDAVGIHRFLDVLLAVSRLSESYLQASIDETRSVVTGQWTLACQFSAWTVPGVPAAWWRGIRRLGSRPSLPEAGRLLLKRMAGRLRRPPRS